MRHCALSSSKSFLPPKRPNALDTLRAVSESLSMTSDTIRILSSSFHLTGGPTQPPSPIRSGRESSRCANRISLSTIFGIFCGKRAMLLAHPPSQPSSRKKAFLSSPDAVMTKEWMHLVRFLPMQPRSNSSISNPGCFAPSSEGFSSFCLSSPRSHSRTSFKKRTSQVPRRYQRTTPCAPFWHSSCSETQDTAMS